MTDPKTLTREQLESYAEQLHRTVRQWQLKAYSMAIRLPEGSQPWWVKDLEDRGILR